ncbi:thrombospondin, type I repeat containing protein [Theileria orientalis]|uniref:Thrombospondin, type I repeat containing protein n=1 Tax=Theileria orientalis TaxID=68886 RepID=A0A976QQP7_THEOR|nr:thrombospondin, type I repeat containing protein [Theileria orientalis]
MDGDVLTNEAEKLKLLSTSRGLKIPNIDEIGEDVSIRDYNLALIDVGNKFEAIYPIVQDIRSKKFMYEFYTRWNPFVFQNTNICKPFFVSEIEDYGFDSDTGSCKCPGVYLPCTLNQSINDKASWSKLIENPTVKKQPKTKPESLKIAISNLEHIDINGNLLEREENLTGDDSKDLVCKSSDVILCSVQDLESQTTEWSDWTGCSTKCGPGIQQRMRIHYDGKTYTLIKESKPCELEKCVYSSGDTPAICALKTIEDNDTFSVVNKCECPRVEDKMCTSEEARKSIDHWLPGFRRFCESEINANEESNILQEDLMDHKRDIMGSNIKIEFSDGFYFDCSENWGINEVDYLHIYCKSGSPILCKNMEEYQPIKFSALEKGRISGIPTYFIVIVWSFLMYGSYKVIRKCFNCTNQK